MVCGHTVCGECASAMIKCDPPVCIICGLDISAAPDPSIACKPDELVARFVNAANLLETQTLAVASARQLLVANIDSSIVRMNDFVDGLIAKLEAKRRDVIWTLQTEKTRRFAILEGINTDATVTAHQLRCQSPSLALLPLALPRQPPWPALINVRLDIDEAAILDAVHAKTRLRVFAMPRDAIILSGTAAKDFCTNGFAQTFRVVCKHASDDFGWLAVKDVYVMFEPSEAVDHTVSATGQPGQFAVVYKVTDASCKCISVCVTVCGERALCLTIPGSIHVPVSLANVDPQNDWFILCHREEETQAILFRSFGSRHVYNLDTGKKSKRIPKQPFPPSTTPTAAACGFGQNHILLGYGEHLVQWHLKTKYYARPETISLRFPTNILAIAAFDKAVLVACEGGVHVFDCKADPRDDRDDLIITPASCIRFATPRNVTAMAPCPCKEKVMLATDGGIFELHLKGDIRPVVSVDVLPGKLVSIAMNPARPEWIYATCEDSAYVHVFRLDGVKAAEFGSGHFTSPRTIAASPDGRVHVMDVEDVDHKRIITFAAH